MRLRIILSGGLLFLLTACGASVHAGPDTVVASFYPLAFAAEEVAPGVPVENLTPPGAEPHDLELTPRQLGAIAEADVVLYLGGGFQPAVEDAIHGARGETVDVGAAAGPTTTTDEEASADPHVWLDPVRYRAIVGAVASALERADGSDAAAFRRNARAFERRVAALDGAYRSGLGACARDVIVTSHAAFGYLASAYGLRQLPLAGLSPEAEPGARSLERLVGEVERSGATTVFTEPLASPRVARTVAREAGATTAKLDPLEGLTPRERERGADYFTVMRANLAALRRGLGCR